MTDKELHRLKRTDLLEILLEQRQEIENLAQDLESTHAKLQERTRAISNAEEVSKAVVALCNAFTAWSPQSAQDRDEESHEGELAAAMQLLQEKTAGLHSQTAPAVQNDPESQPALEISDGKL